MSYSKQELGLIEKKLVSLKAELDNKSIRFTAEDYERKTQYVKGLQQDLEKELKKVAIKEAVVYTATGLTIISTIIAWFMAQSIYVQAAVVLVGLLIAAGLIYYIVQSKDRRQAILDLIQLAKDIIAILKDLQPSTVAPTSAFNSYPPAGKAPLTVTFTDQSTGQPTSWQWSFGDGTTSNSQNTSHVYTKPGTFAVTLQASNTAGSSIKSNTVTVTQEPTPDPEPVSDNPPGLEWLSVGSEKVAYIGGDHQDKIDEWEKGGEGWPAGKVKVMDSLAADFDVLPNHLFAYYYSGSLMPPGIHISQQGYYYLKNPTVSAVNEIRAIRDKPWIQPGIAFSEVRKIEKVNGTHVITVMHDGQEQRIVWGPRQ
jgi:PKD repeat protein